MNKRVFWLLLVLLAIFLLRVPSWFEPYWYGDEGIYLVLGQAMQRGAVLYRDIWDNKPPLLYAIYALHPTLLWAKVSATLFVLGTCAGVWLLSKKLFTNYHTLNTNLITIYQSLVTLLCGVFLTLPLLEGTIANAELYFTLPIVWGGYLILRHPALDAGSIQFSKSYRFPVKPGMTMVVVGLLMSAAFLLKVPALFDFLGFFVYLGIIYMGDFWEKKNLGDLTAKLFTTFLPVAAAFLLPLVAVVVYFQFNQALKDFLTASFLQNSSYVAVDSGPWSKLSNPLFVKAAILLILLMVIALGYFRKKISAKLVFMILWFGFSLYGALLSNRNYPHYLLQIVPPTVTLAVLFMSNIKRHFVGLIFLLVVLAMLYGKVGNVKFVPDFSYGFAMDPEKYYLNWFDYISERKSWEEYVNFFDSRTLGTYRLAQYIKKNTSPDDSIFIWADASFPYVLSGRKPATKFIQAHHLTTIDPINYDLIVQKIAEVKPKLILLPDRPYFQFPKLYEYTKANYHEMGRYGDLHFYKVLE